MARFYFDVYEEDRITFDEEGSICLSEKAACEMANTIMAQIVADDPGGAGQRHLVTNVRDNSNHVVYTSALTVVGTWLEVPMPALLEQSGVMPLSTNPQLSMDLSN